MRTSDFEYDRDLSAIEYGVRSRDGLNGERITPKPTLAMAEDYLAYLERISATRNTYGIHAELIHRWPGGEWTVLSSEDAQQIKDEAWAGLDRAMEPVLRAAAAQQETTTVRNPDHGDRGCGRMGCCVPVHVFVRHADPRFGSAFGGGCGAQHDGVTCGWPEVAHQAADPAGLVTRPYAAGSAAVSTDRVHLVFVGELKTECCGSSIGKLPAGEQWTTSRSLANCASKPGDGR